ncbi:basic helix-loop-helix (bHLH) DNA-binding superfamily protein [Actinidia rufa]|uniref:Basic helix-loop-helix (BHLH) DNA-binding superfamily protein n=1 Tax=Actinidia rufa TaxID=165716 RepID=A0A7J0G9J5_9ERIC|nr:basic helix-loop-helix (bHLH) DNA-binding superfamily protein [Actinidia rufa]
MAEEFHLSSGNWWENLSRNRYVDAGSSQAEPNSQLMGLGLSSQAMDWNNTSLVRGGKVEDNFLHTGANFPQETTMESSQNQWREKMYSENSSATRGFSLDQPQFTSAHISSCESIVTTSFQMDPATYGNSSIQGLLLGSDNQQQRPIIESRPMNYPYPPVNYNQFPQFLRSSSPPKLPSHSQLQFSNNTPFWNATVANDDRSNFFLSSLQGQFNPPTFDEKPKVRKEKMGDRITALQQLVSPFGKTDTASVLSEAIEYIKFLHQQVNVLSTPYMKSGASMQQQQTSDKKQDLISRGLCLVPVSSTFPVTHENAVDFWTPTFGGTFR